MHKLTGSVGKRGSNHVRDVRTVQDLLNLNLRFLIPWRPVEVTGHVAQTLVDVIEAFQHRVVKMPHPDGRVDPEGRTFYALVAGAVGGRFIPPDPHAPPAPPPRDVDPSAVKPDPAATPGGPPAPAKGEGKRYTSNANEVADTYTTPAIPDLVKAIVAQTPTSFPGLTENGARTLAAQGVHETGGFKHCHCWNFGNVKSPKDNVLHVYLKNVWEPLPDGLAKKFVENSNGSAHFATEEELKKHPWWGVAGKTTVIFMPPNPQARFRAFGSMSEGVQFWMAHHARTAAKHPAFLKQLNDGDSKGVAKTLKDAHYYTGDEKQYATSMSRAKAAIDKQLGPIK